MYRYGPLLLKQFTATPDSEHARMGCSAITSHLLCLLPEVTVQNTFGWLCVKSTIFCILRLSRQKTLVRSAWYLLATTLHTIDDGAVYLQLPPR